MPGSFTSALAAAVRKVYGMTMLTELRPLHFAGPVSGSRWLLIIDGLDEVVDGNSESRSSARSGDMPAQTRRTGLS